MINNKLARMAKAKVLIGLFIAALPFLGFFQYREMTLKHFSNECRSTLDSNISYTSEDAYELFGKLKEGRKLYAWTEITVDIIFPIIYSLFLSLLIIYISQRCLINKSPQFLAILPFIAMLFDYGEHVLIAFMLFNYPQEHLALASIASLFTKLKLGLLVISFLAILFGLACLMIQSDREPCEPQPRAS
jgi:hypothetical protein